MADDAGGSDAPVSPVPWIAQASSIRLEDGHTLWDYLQVVSNDGPVISTLAAVWESTPDQVVYALARDIVRRDDEFNTLRGELAALKESNAELADRFGAMADDVDAVIDQLDESSEVVPSLRLVPDDPKVRVDAIAGMDVATSIVDDPEYVEGEEFGPPPNLHVIETSHHPSAHRSD